MTANYTKTWGKSNSKSSTTMEQQQIAFLFDHISFLFLSISRTIQDHSLIVHNSSFFLIFETSTFSHLQMKTSRKPPTYIIEIAYTLGLYPKINFLAKIYYSWYGTTQRKFKQWLTKLQLIIHGSINVLSTKLYSTLLFKILLVFQHFVTCYHHLIRVVY